MIQIDLVVIEIYSFKNGSVNSEQRPEKWAGFKRLKVAQILTVKK